MRQSKKDVIEYYIEMVNLYQELDSYSMENWVCKEYSTRYKLKLKGRKCLSFLQDLTTSFMRSEVGYLVGDLFRLPEKCLLRFFVRKGGEK